MIELSHHEQEFLLEILKERFATNYKNFSNLAWPKIESKLLNHPEKLWSLHEMERTSGEPSLLDYDLENDELVFCDFSKKAQKKGEASAMTK